MPKGHTPTDSLEAILGAKYLPASHALLTPVWGDITACGSHRQAGYCTFQLLSVLPWTCAMKSSGWWEQNTVFFKGMSNCSHNRERQQFSIYLNANKNKKQKVNKCIRCNKEMILSPKRY